MYTDSLLGRIFSLQDQVTARHISQNPDRFSLLSDALALLSAIDMSPAEWDAIPVQMRSLFNYFHADTFSCIVSSARLCFHGCSADAFALMRVALENLTILDYIASKGLYQDAFAEMQQRAARGKPFSDAFSYDRAISVLQITDRRTRLWGQMSAMGSHASPPRLSLALAKRGEGHRTKPGLSLDDPNIPHVLGELTSLTLFALRVVNDFLKLYAPLSQVTFSMKLVSLEARYEALKPEQ
ncbi:MAG: hypothetical protein ABSF61_10800 [Anaerolineales bacterium]